MEQWTTYYTSKYNKYEVSNLGRIKKNNIIQELRNDNGYISCTGRWVHRLVAKYFVNNPNNYKEVDHIDGNRSNNVYTNLRWVTHKQNMNTDFTKRNISISTRNAMKRVPKEQLQSVLNKVTVNKDNKTIYINKEELNNYLNDGWKIGRGKYKKSK